MSFSLDLQVMKSSRLQRQHESLGQDILDAAVQIGDWCSLLHSMTIQGRVVRKTVSENPSSLLLRPPERPVASPGVA